MGYSRFERRGFQRRLLGLLAEQVGLLAELVVLLAVQEEGQQVACLLLELLVEAAIQHPQEYH